MPWKLRVSGSPSARVPLLRQSRPSFALSKPSLPLKPAATKNVFVGTCLEREQVLVNERRLINQRLKQQLMAKFKQQSYFKDWFPSEAKTQLLSWFDKLVSGEKDLNREILLRETPCERHTITPFQWFDLLITDELNPEQQQTTKFLSGIDMLKKAGNQKLAQSRQADLAYSKGNFYETRFDLGMRSLQALNPKITYDKIPNNSLHDICGVDGWLTFKNSNHKETHIAVQLKSSSNAVLAERSIGFQPKPARTRLLKDLLMLDVSAFSISGLRDYINTEVKPVLTSIAAGVTTVGIGVPVIVAGVKQTFFQMVKIFINQDPRTESSEANLLSWFVIQPCKRR